MEYVKLTCEVQNGAETRPDRPSALNEFNVQLGPTNSALRYRLWVDDHPIEDDVEIIGDGFIVSTPFGSTAYYRQITRGIFYSGLGIAFKYTSELVNHLVVPETSVIRAEITRGPATLGHDNAPDNLPLDTGDVLIIRKDDHPATLLTLKPLRRPSDEF